MRRWLIIGGFGCVAGFCLWLALRAQKPSASPGQGADLAPAAGAPAVPRRPGPVTFPPAPPRAGTETPEERPRPPGRSLVPQFDPFLERLHEAAQAGNLERAAAENGVRLKGDRVRVVIRPTLGDADKVREAVRVAGGEVVRTIDRDQSAPVFIAWVPARALLALAENQAVRSLHRPVGMHAKEAPEPPGPRPPPP